MRSDNAVRASLVIIGLCASLTLGLSACGSTSNEGSSGLGEESLRGQPGRGSRMPGGGADQQYPRPFYESR